MQIPALDAAHRLGYSVHLADGNNQCPGIEKADYFYHIDIRNKERLLRCAQNIENIKAIFTTGTDFSQSAAWVSQKLHLPGIPYEASVNATHKGKMRTCLRKAGVQVPEFLTIHIASGSMAANEQLMQCHALGFPIVVKPVDNMGARGVVMAAKKEDLPDALHQACAASISDTAIVEQYISGREYSIDALIYDGEIRVTGIADRHIFFRPYFVELGHTMPADLSEKQRNILIEGFQKAVRALNITRGAAKGDIFLVDNTVVVGEIAARLSGGYMSGWTYPLATGVCITELAIRIAAGESPSEESFQPIRESYVVERALMSAPGIIREVEKRRTHVQVSDVFLRCKEGDRVVLPRNNVEKVANVIAAAPTKHEAEEAALYALDALLFRLEAADPETDRFLFQTGWQSIFCRYESRGDMDMLIHMLGIFGTYQDLQNRVRAEKALPVFRMDTSVLVAVQPALAPELLLAALEKECIVHMTETPPMFGSLFWYAFLAAGRQGVMYVRDSFLENTQGILEYAQK